VKNITLVLSHSIAISDICSILQVKLHNSRDMQNSQTQWSMTDMQTVVQRWWPKTSF